MQLSRISSIISFFCFNYLLTIARRQILVVAFMRIVNIGEITKLDINTETNISGTHLIAMPEKVNVSRMALITNW